MKYYLNKYLKFSKTNKSTIFTLKALVLIIINLWLLMIFWKIIILDGINLTNNNIALTKMQTLLNPVLTIMGLEMLSPNNIKMVIISTFIIGINLSVLYFNQMIILGIIAGMARYGYKSYTNYLINKENLNYMGFEAIKTAKEVIKEDVLPKVVEQAPIIINTGGQSSTNLWMWGGIIVVGVVAAVGIGIAIWSHNTNAGNLINVNQGVERVNTSLNNINNNLNEKISRSIQQIDYNNSYTTNTYNNLDKKVNFIDFKVDSLSNTVQEVSSDLARVNSLGNENVIKLSQESLKLSQKASEAIAEIAEASTTAEGATLAVAKIWERVKERLDIIETKLGIGTNTETITSPRRPSIHFPVTTRKDE